MNLSELDLKYDAVSIVPVNNSVVLVASMNDEYMSSLMRYFTNKVKNAQFMPSYKSGNWDGKIRFIQNNGLMPRGLLSECIKKLEEWGYKYELDSSLETKVINIDNFDAIIKNELIDKQPEGISITPWEHQEDGAKALLKAKRGVIKAATSAGKSFIITMVAKYLFHSCYAKKILLVVPRSDLVIQFQRDAIEYGMDEKDIGMFFGSIKDTEQKWIVGTWQSLQNVEDPEFFAQFDCLMVDEVHGSGTGSKTSKKKRESSGTQMRQICDKCVNAEWRFGCTGTLPTDPLELRTIISGIGPLVYEVTAAQLMKKGHITKLKINIPFINYDKKMVKEKMQHYLLEDGIDDSTPKADIPIQAKFNAEKRFIEGYVPRLKLMSRIVKSRLDKEENVLILANTRNFGDKIMKTLQFLNKDDYNHIFYIHGQVDEMKRKEIRQIMEDNTKVIIIATTSLFSTGISVKNLHNVIFGNIGKSKIVTLQSIGRSLRQHSTKEYARVYDLCDNLKYNAKHAQERMNYYSSEDFEINIIELTL